VIVLHGEPGSGSSTLVQQALHDRVVIGVKAT
jgi:predicted kinase